MKDLLIKRFLFYKNLGDETLGQIPEQALFWQPDPDSNSIAILVKHIAGNMLSRWTNFLTEDGEKDWRNRDAEFESTFITKQEVEAYWEQGWACLFSATEQISDENLYKLITIRTEQLTVIDAVLRQLAHYAYHIGQMVYIAKMHQKEDWKTLSIAKNKSEAYNHQMREKTSEEQENASPVCFAKSPEIRDEYRTE